MTSPRLLSIAGSDSGGGAGIQADLKTFAAHGAYGMTAITALTAQNTLGVRAIHAVPPEFVAAQIDAVFEDLGVDAVKIGMLADAGIAAVVAERLTRWAGPPVVLDPVMLAASGDPLLEPEAVEVIRTRLMPLATLVTPNLPEAEALAGRRVSSLDERAALARELGRETGAVLLKGAHAPGAEIVDLLWDGRAITEFRHPRIETRAGHGTGCTLSSSIAARLALGQPLIAACGGAIEWLACALAQAEPLGRGAGPVDHLWETRTRRTLR
ncbi:MAG: hydroxymethylpyrimidine/phosphomethylpyrimidine kinase [Acidobacteriota bacterium]